MVIAKTLHGDPWRTAPVNSLINRMNGRLGFVSHVGSYGLDVSRVSGDDLVGGHTRLPRLG
jgi:hypothetical protein